MARVLFGDNDTFRVLEDVGTPPSGWNSDAAFDDSAWDARAQGCGSTSTSVTSPDLRDMISTTRIKWRSELQRYPSGVGDDLLRAVVILTADDISAGVRASVGMDNGTRLYVNGSTVFDEFNGSGDVSAVGIDIAAECVVGANVFAIFHQSGGDDGANPLQSHAWLEVVAGSGWVVGAVSIG